MMYFKQFCKFHFLVITLFALPLMSQDKYVFKNVKIGGGGFVTGVVFNETQKDLFYTRTDVGGAYRFDKPSQKWIQLLEGIGRGETYLRDVESIATDPLDTNRLYIAAGEWDYTRILRSLDKGQSFTYITPPFKMSGNGSGRGKGERLIIDPNLNNTLYYGTRYDGLYKSTDYASNWSKVTSLPIVGTDDGVGIVFIVLDTRNTTKGTATKTMYVGVSRKTDNLYKTTDGGATWQVVNGTPSGQQPHNAGIDANGILYVSFCDEAGPNGISSGAVWKYNTATAVWTNITPPTGQGGFGGLAVDKNKAGTVMVATINRWWPGDQVYRSINGGTTWGNVDDNSVRDASIAPYVYGGNLNVKPGAGNWIDNMIIDPHNSNRVMYVTGAGIWASNDLTNHEAGKTTHWSFFVEGIEEMGAYDMISPATGANLLTSFGDIGGFRHDNLALSPPEGFFNPPGWGTNTSIDFAQNNPNLVFRTYISQTNGAYSTDNGKTWTPFASSAMGSGQHTDDITVSANGTNLLWGMDDFPPSYSTNNGATWTPSAGVPQSYWYSIISDRINNNKFYLYHSQTGYVYVSTNGGANFSKAGFAQSWGGQVIANPWQEGDIFVPAWDGLYHSTNSGQSFVKIANVDEASSITFGKTAPGKSYPTLFLMGRVNNVWGFYRSIDAGATWLRTNTNANQYGYDAFIVGDERTFGRFYISTHCMGVAYGEIDNSTCTTPATPVVSSNTLSYCQNATSIALAATGTSLRWYTEPTGGTASTVAIVPNTSTLGSTTYYVSQVSADGNCESARANITVTVTICDCSGAANGTATLDNCDRCVGGTTGKTACVAYSEIETDACSFDGVVESTNPGFKGTGYINVPNALGSKISFNVNATVAGTYTLSFRYASGGTADRQATVQLNGIALANTQSFSPTGSFAVYKTLDITLPLKSGTNTIQLTATTTEGLANIDQVGYVSAGLSKGNCLITIVEDFDLNQEVYIYPNPSKANFHVVNANTSAVQVMDMKGKILEEHKNASHIVFGENLTLGIYFIKIDNKVYKAVKE